MREVVRISVPTPFPAGPANVFLVKGDPPLLVDAAANTDEAWDKLNERLEDHGVRAGDIGAVLLTHGHLDHIGLISRVVEASGAHTCAHPYVVDQCRDYNGAVEEGNTALAGVFRQCGVPAEHIEEALAHRTQNKGFGVELEIDQALKDGDEVFGLEARHVPGHSVGDVLFYAPESRAAFTGDHVLKGISPNPLLRRPKPGQPRGKSLLEYHASLQRTRALDIAMCYPGHGSPFDDHRAVIDHLLERHEKRTQEILEMLSPEPTTAYALMRRLFPKLGPPAIFFGLSVAAGHLEVLESQGLIYAEERGGVTCFARS